MGHFIRILQRFRHHFLDIAKNGNFLVTFEGIFNVGGRFGLVPEVERHSIVIILFGFNMVPPMEGNIKDVSTTYNSFHAMRLSKFWKPFQVGIVKVNLTLSIMGIRHRGRIQTVKLFGRKENAPFYASDANK
uniref:Uncharacterized protein n=1 Tax=Cacopsylla melanoneura TaxID=428564 RepID=A0A8D8UDY7_9HEMI